MPHGRGTSAPVVKPHHLLKVPSTKGPEHRFTERRMVELSKLATGLLTTSVYDYLINLPDEGEEKYSYYVTRTLMIDTAQFKSGLDVKACTKLLTAINAFQSAEVMFSESLSSASVLSVTLLLVMFVPSIEVMQLDVPGITGCVKSRASSIMFATYLVIIGIELVILVLILTQALRTLNQSHCRLLKTMMHDGSQQLYLTYTYINNIETGKLFGYVQHISNSLPHDSCFAHAASSNQDEQTKLQPFSGEY
ncbi:hypothetical protein CONPUDRAFT_70589 [Coniophora puteana RWD-64-598 SS2]|uniref:Uncharacterized protein n=1 Tax=Coniophora puteana (strain RWD-64-598) TaxID=741705 RepID=A0A5M3MWZ9_CONPW|nr:uncharacterized protein CONPUDRAFT_70589 [Coniophora puteana RWD-64-598 SS2]EIW83600.1 hypothetical protein CONPUDRAFT_70589 [Coniophora puteana RWD-64-598 SS2]